MTPLNDHVKHAKQLMDKAVEAVKREFSTVRTGKATTALLDLVRVEAYGNEMPLTQVASVAAPEPKLLTVQPWDKGLLKAVEKGILASDLGLTPSNDGNIIRGRQAEVRGEDALLHRLQQPFVPRLHGEQLRLRRRDARHLCQRHLIPIGFDA